MNNVIKVTKEIPKNAQILLVGVGADHLEGTDYDWSPEVYGKVDERIEKMIETVNALNEKGHAVYLNADADCEKYVFEPLRHFPITPTWGIYNLPVPENEVDPAKIYHLNPEFANFFDKEKVILVGGLWREQFVLSVVRLLAFNGYKAVLSLNDDLSLQASIAVYEEDCDISVEENCEKANLKIEEYEGVSE